ncbi:hypothetical protein [Moheibacter sediminis]|nr:hypothetical protein [Moheibacter sediminis]
MKKIFFSTAFILLFGLMGFSQNSEIKLLMKNATSVVVPNNFKYFHLVDSSFPIDFDEKSMTSNELQKLRNDFPDFPYEEFLSLAKSDTSLIDWNDFEIKNARIHQYQNIPQFRNLIRNYQLVPYDISKKELDEINRNKQSDVAVVRVKKEWDEQRIQRECHDVYNQNYKNIKKEDSDYFWFSKPLMSKKGFALITLNESNKGATYVFKKIDGQWKNIFVFNHWSS